VLASGQVALLDPPSQRAFLLRVEEGNLVDLLEIGLQAAFGGNGGAPVRGSGCLPITSDRTEPPIDLGALRS
jgi:hypothetical protein